MLPVNRQNIVLPTTDVHAYVGENRTVDFRQLIRYEPFLAVEFIHGIGRFQGESPPWRSTLTSSSACEMYIGRGATSERVKCASKGISSILSAQVRKLSQ